MELIKSNDPTPLIIVDDIPIPIPPPPPPIPPTFPIGTICSNKSARTRIGEIKDTSGKEGGEGEKGEREDVTCSCWEGVAEGWGIESGEG